MGDTEIIELLFARSEGAVEALRQKYGKLCRGIAMGILGDARDAEECENDAWLQVWNAIPPERPQYLRAYVCRVARNLALNRWKSDRRQKRGGELESIHSELLQCLPDGRDVQAAADDTVLQCVRAFLEGQDARSRALFLGRYFYARPVKELAGQFYMKQSAVSTRLGRMRAKLKLELEKEGITL